MFQNVFGQCLRDIPAAAFGYGLSSPSPCLGSGLPSSCLGVGLSSPGTIGLSGLAASGLGLSAGLLATDSTYDISSGAYGGSGVGNLNVFGELPVGGSTLVSGQVPILGSVSFGGPLPAAGSVIISGSCNCGCDYGY